MRVKGWLGWFQGTVSQGPWLFISVALGPEVRGKVRLSEYMMYQKQQIEATLQPILNAQHTGLVFHKGLESNSGPLEGQMLLTAEPSCQPGLVFYCYVRKLPETSRLETPQSL